MEKRKIQTILKELNIVGLTDKDLDKLGYWYSYFTHKRSKGYCTELGCTLGYPIVNKKNNRKGLMLFSNILSRLDEFDSTLIVESLNKKNSVCFKCNNKIGENLVINFTNGDLIDHPTTLSIIGSNSVKRAFITLNKGILLDELSYYNLQTNDINEYYQTIYNEAYGVEAKNYKG